ncbi:MAG: hypothetical protein PHQ12_10760, partial [Chthoniobacteraceae bacterium]|nr:hypothetical protein [Chthoniobacteraceae bacterium]
FLLLLLHWSNVKAAWDALLANYADVQELARLEVDFFPAQEGTPDPKLLEHVRKLAAAGIIDMTFENAIPRSPVSVIEGWVK